MRNFENWETQDLEMTFGLNQVWDNKLITDWLSATATFSEFETELIERIRVRILKNVEFWNEDELKLQSIASIIEMANFTSDAFKSFSQRPLSATINGIEIGGRVDFMLAKGRQRPIEPYFFIHEWNATRYKQETKRGSNDPKGQLLSELLTAQARNTNKFSLYGCYVLGRNWFFMVLDGSEYVVSNAFNSSDEDIYKIIAILRQVRINVENLHLS
jgi:hypothetical protein